MLTFLPQKLQYKFEKTSAQVRFVLLQKYGVKFCRSLGKLTVLKMSSEEFLLSVFSSNIDLYIISFIISQLSLFCFYRYRVRSLLDPFLIIFFFLGCANAIPILLYLTGNVNEYLFAYFLISQICFLGTFYIKSRGLSKKQSLKTSIPCSCFEPLFVSFCVFLYVFSVLYYIKLNGVPLLNENRFAININNSSGILGLLGRLKQSLELVIVLYAIHLYYHKKKRNSIPLLLIIIFSSLLFGSKGFIHVVVQGFFFYHLFYRGSLPLIKRKYIALIIISPILVILLSGVAYDGKNAFLYLGYRLLASGDLYWNAYPNNMIDNVVISNPLLNMTFFFWGPFRHILGIQVADDTMVTGGSLVFELSSSFFPKGGAPNSSFAFMSWVYYGWYGIFFLLIMGAICSYLCYTLPNRMNNTLINTAIKGQLYMSSIAFFVDIYLLFNSLFNLLLFFFIYKFMQILYKYSSNDMHYK